MLIKRQKRSKSISKESQEGVKREEVERGDRREGGGEVEREGMLFGRKGKKKKSSRLDVSRGSNCNQLRIYIVKLNIHRHTYARRRKIPSKKTHNP